MLRFVCPCGRQLQAREEDVGKKARCPSCGEVMTIPAEADEPAPKRGPPRLPDTVQEDRPRKSASRRDRDDEDDYDDYDDERPRRKRRRSSYEQPNSTKATVALILGVGSFCLPILPAIPAVILGILALREIGASRDRLGGKGLAITGLVTGCVSMIVWAAAGVLLMPVYDRIGEAKARQQDANNLKQLAIAMHNYHDSMGTFPNAVAYRTKDGQPGLSWRVAILPYIEQEGLFRSFKLDEPWDSLHNVALLAKMPKTYRHPRQRDDPASGLTHYQVFSGEGALFELPGVHPGHKPGMPIPGMAPPGVMQRGFPLHAITDGTSNTLLIATAQTPVPWTKPDDLPFDLRGPLPPLGGLYSRGSNVVMADAAVRWIDPNTPEPTLRAFITRHGGEVVNWP